MLFHENRLPADHSHEISCLICFILESSKNLICPLLQIIGGALMVKPYLPPPPRTAINVPIYSHENYYKSIRLKKLNFINDLRRSHTLTGHSSSVHQSHFIPNKIKFTNLHN